MASQEIQFIANSIGTISGNELEALLAEHGGNLQHVANCAGVALQYLESLLAKLPHPEHLHAPMKVGKDQATVSVVSNSLLIPRDEPIVTHDVTPNNSEAAPSRSTPWKLNGSTN